MADVVVFGISKNYKVQTGFSAPSLLYFLTEQYLPLNMIPYSSNYESGPRLNIFFLLTEYSTDLM